MTRLELATSPPPAARATNCATSRYLIFYHLLNLYLGLLGPRRHDKFLPEIFATPPQLTTSIARNQFPALRPATGDSHPSRAVTSRDPGIARDKHSLSGEFPCVLPPAILTTNCAFVPISLNYTLAQAFPISLSEIAARSRPATPELRD